MTSNINHSKTRYANIGAVAFFLFGMLLVLIGGRLILYQQLLTNYGQEVVGTIIDTGSTRNSSGGYVNFIRYRFEDDSGDIHEGQSSGYSGEIGETILVEYSSLLPFTHRVAGEGQGISYQWRWAILGAGVLFAFAGIHWFLQTWGRVRLGSRLMREGVLVRGTVRQITDSGRTITYLYRTQAGSFRGKSIALPKTLVQQYGEEDEVVVLYDPKSPKRSVLKIEL